MLCRITDLRYKEVINVSDGSCLGYVSTLRWIQLPPRFVLIIYGRAVLRPFFAGMISLIRWCDIEVIGEDTILQICAPNSGSIDQKHRNFGRLFDNNRTRLWVLQQ